MGGWSWLPQPYFIEAVPMLPGPRTIPPAAHTGDGCSAADGASVAEPPPSSPIIEPSAPAPGQGTDRAAEGQPEQARLRRNLTVVSGGILKHADSSGFVDLFAARVTLSEPHPLLALLLASFSSEDIDAAVAWRLAVDGEPGTGAILGRPVVGKSESRKALTVYGISSPLQPGEHTVRVQVSSDRPTAVAVRPAVSAGVEGLRLILFELP